MRMHCETSREKDSRLLVSHFAYRNVSVTRWRATKSVCAVREKLIDRRNIISPREKKNSGASEFLTLCIKRIKNAEWTWISRRSNISPSVTPFSHQSTTFTFVPFRFSTAIFGSGASKISIKRLRDSQSHADLNRSISSYLRNCTIAPRKIK